MIADKINMDYAKEIIVRLRNMGTAVSIDGESLGFRGAGSRSAKEASLYVKDEMIRIGLAEVTLDEVPVDAWEFRGAWVDVPGLKRMQAASFGGSSGTNGELKGEMVDVGNGIRSDYDGKDVKGKIALVNWSGDSHIGILMMEAKVHGAIAVVLTTYDNNRFGMGDGALQCHDGYGRREYPPVISISGRDGLAIIESLKSSSGPVDVTLCSDIVLTPREDGGHGWNVVGYLPGENWGTEDDELLIIGDHTDAWFFGACDNNTGVAFVLVLADALKRAYDESGIRPHRTIVFVAHEAEEYGIVETYYTWCWGAWYEITHHHPEWVGKSVAGLFVDCIGFRGHPLSVESTRELAKFTETVIRRNDSNLPHGCDFRGLSTWADHWTYAASGIGAILFSDWSEDYINHYYHSQYDDLDVIDYDYLRKVFVILADLADSLITAPIIPLDLKATAGQLRSSFGNGSELSVTDLQSLHEKYNLDQGEFLGQASALGEEFNERVDRLADALSNQNLTDGTALREINRHLMGIQASLGRSLISIGVKEEDYLPHQQSAIDMNRLDRVIDILSHQGIAKGDLARAEEELSNVGIASICKYVSEPTYRDFYDLICGAGVNSWGTQVHLQPIVDVWEEYHRLCGMMEDDSIPAEDLEHLTSSLTRKIAGSASVNLEKSFETICIGLKDANAQIDGLMAVLEKRSGG